LKLRRDAAVRWSAWLGVNVKNKMKLNIVKQIMRAVCGIATGLAISQKLLGHPDVAFWMLVCAVVILELEMCITPTYDA